MAKPTISDQDITAREMVDHCVPLAYRMYVLTVWQEAGQAGAPDQGLRFRLSDPQTGKSYGFTDAGLLLSALQQAGTENHPNHEKASEDVVDGGFHPR